MRIRTSIIVGIGAILSLGGAQSGCGPDPSAASIEQASQDTQQKQMLRNQPVPSYDFSLERHILIQIYTARQKAVSTYSVVQSPYTGKILWQCPSIGFPLPYATQLTNPLQLTQNYTSNGHYIDGVVAQQEPNGLYSPPQSDATWVPCVDASGNITPVYEEKHVTVFFQPMTEVNGELVAAAGSKPSLTINPNGQ